MTARILIVEDEKGLAFGLQRNLEFDGYEVDVAHDGRAALMKARTDTHDLMILDLMLPELDGLSVLERMRSEGLDMPVLILTALGEEPDKVRGLKAGADDYLTKPFGLGELLARVETLLRRARPTSAPTATKSAYRFGDVEVDLGTHTVRRGGRKTELAPREFDLLVALLRAEGAVQSRRHLMRDVWGHKASVVSRTVDTHVAELRRKLEADPSNPRFILTVRKVGYRLDTAAD